VGDERVTASVLDAFERAIRLADSSTRLIFNDTEGRLRPRGALSMTNEVGATFVAYGLTACAQ